MKLRWNPDVLAGIELYYGYKAKCDRAAAKNFLFGIAEAAGRLLFLPMSGRPCGESGMRIWAVPGVPYIIVYRIRDKTVDIVRMVYTGRD